MRAKPGVIEALNSILTGDLTAINEYFLAAEMCLNWGYHRLYEKFRELSMQEMEDAQSLIRHILFFEGLPNLQRLGTVRVGENVDEQFRFGLEQEQVVIDALNNGVQIAASQGDYMTRNLLEKMVYEELEHVDWLETQIETIGQIGLQNYLGHQIKD
jgi:bacterioferritin